VGTVLVSKCFRGWTLPVGVDNSLVLSFFYEKNYSTDLVANMRTVYTVTHTDVNTKQQIPPRTILLGDCRFVKQEQWFKHRGHFIRAGGGYRRGYRSPLVERPPAAAGAPGYHLLKNFEIVNAKYFNIAHLAGKWFAKRSQTRRPLVCLPSQRSLNRSVPSVPIHTVYTIGTVFPRVPLEMTVLRGPLMKIRLFQHYSVHCAHD